MADNPQDPLEPKFYELVRHSATCSSIFPQSMHLGSEAKPSTKHEVLLSMLAIGLLEERQFSERQGSNEAPVSRRKPDRTQYASIDRGKQQAK